ncbi:hypothetical protein HYDPIDRAFT_116592 [Hydnomerulius pinastri MD-312]|uniref:Aprataxin and PNK-like factor PBZ domain-containing protein n=1 Tax=Hydnomerulius pinastri MD-312 TaxID=994086 RepID=A0A0C9VSM5_9AGAM|nr:hypothetical protein HYDPIDRAFT_116592 [Hydnomerulius pinastri MD-312]
MRNFFQAMQSPFVNADLVDRILTSLPDFSSLVSTILTSKAVYAVYKAHPTSIQRAVAYNLVGSALPEALRLVRCRRRGMTLKPPNELLGEDDIVKNPQLTRDEIKDLVGISGSAKRLEELFSWREKDCRFQSSSQLTVGESHRFNRALFRLSLYSSAYGEGAYVEDDFLDEDDPDGDLLLENALSLRKRFFETFPTIELEEIKSFTSFLTDIIHWAMNAHSYFDMGSTDKLLFYGSLPHIVSDMYLGVGESPDDETRAIPEGFWDGFVPRSISVVLKQRKAPVLTDEQAKRVIIDEVVGGNVNCTQCHAGPMPRKDLWCPSTWDFLRGTIPPHAIRQRLPGYLPGNDTHGPAITDIWEINTYSELIDQLFEHKTNAFDSWKREDFLCTGCLGKFLEEHIWVWYVGEKRKRGEVIPEDCWYGYNCRTQRHKPAHASRLNHFCEPSRGDAPA